MQRSSGSTSVAASSERKIFDYRALRLVVGMLAFALPVLVWIRSSEILPSISGSYHTDARDIFVGILFFIAAFLFAYKGDFRTEAWASTVACIAAIMVAVFPTNSTCETTIVGIVHYLSAAILFGILAYFCFHPFRKKVKHLKGKPGRRSGIYFGCGVVIAGALVFAFITGVFIPCEVSRGFSFTFWAEFAALWAFGIAWIVSGKAIPALTDEHERYRIFSNER